ncbi:hypothetical protein IPC75_08895 [Pseudomonas aeruginosa]|uniref:hypothetical protein n=1 Tax=Pseudomonas aeruginosa TaxID=287 RepID=UPI0010683413|nr:hypothetical protein [Pseudomonas aeruginosa]TEP34615.1 hypothetical protein IPC78_06540 [Pseudomonas aeruginosa]TEP38743.1 hypothetical protein IPC76_11865 [Pseudomonas aeruginosa]TEP40198.1 hypothetical protein IPC77_23690 [Pseudomonas aeruginosa]TEP48856.1 hypothetical protein IPC75_08895 [Pseudomonas aeruginosa]
MIPVAPLPLIVPLIYLSSFVAGIWLLVWLSLLAFSPRARQRLRRRWPSRGLLMLLLLIPLGLRAWLEIGLWQYERERAREEAAHSAVLERPTRLGGIEMPAGTRLKLELKHQPESFREAEFPTPVTIRGVATRHLQRWLQSEQDNPQDPWKTTGVHPTSLRLHGEGVAEIEGWRCDASQEIAFASERDGRPAAFEGCSLAIGNRADDIDFPAGARLFASDGMVYTDGYRDAERWRVMPETGQRVSVRGIALSGGALAFDRDRRLYGLGGTVLAEALQLGAWHYPAGTEVSLSPRAAWRAQHPHAWLFSPTREAASHASGERLEHGVSLLQTLDGQELERLDNRAAGVIDFIELEIGDER